MKPSDGRYQTATQVKVLSLEITNIREVDSIHELEDSTCHIVKARYGMFSRGLSPWYGIERRLQELGRPDKFSIIRVSANNPKRRGSGEGLSGVGLTHSRGVVPLIRDESGIEGHSKGLAFVCKGEGTHILHNEVD